MKVFVSIRRWIGGIIFILILDGSVRASAQAPIITGDPEYLAVPVGATANFSVGVSSPTFLTFQWYRGTQQVPGATSDFLTIPNVSPADQGQYFVVVSNISGTATSAPASLVVFPIMPGMVDPAFHPGFGPNGVVRVVRVDTDGRIYLGGEFTSVNQTSRSRLARLDSNGGLDSSFTASISNFVGFPSVYTLTIQTNHQVLVAGSFTHANGVPRQGLARLNSDGTLDTSFNAQLNGFSSVWAVTLQSDGRILIGGDFTSVLGNPINRIARLNSDGTFDFSFNPGTGMNNSVRAITVQPDGRIIVGGNFTTVNNQLRSRIIRLTDTGAIDPAFNAAASLDSWVNAIVLQADGKIVLGGSFANVNSALHPVLARLDANGFVDASFNPDIASGGALTSVAIQPDGKIIIGGAFYALGGQDRQNFARLNANGTIDAGFYPYAGANSWVESLALDSGGNILLAGDFFNVSGVARTRVARVFGGEPVPFAPIITTQPVRQTNRGEGDHFELFSRALSFPAPTYFWRLNGTHLPGANQTHLFRENVRLSDAGNYQLLASNALGTVTSRVSVVTITPARTGPGALDIDFYTGTGPDNDVRSIAAPPDGSAIIGGWFSSVDGFPQPYLARLLTNGNLDVDDFDPLLNNIATRVGNSPSNFVGVAGYFSFANELNQAFALYQTNGNLVPGFSSSIVPFGIVQAFAFQSNSQVIVAGYFVASNSPVVTRTNLARLNPDGSVDVLFDAGEATYQGIYDMAIDHNRRILIGGGFSSIQGIARRGIARLNYYGDIDLSFNTGSGANGDIRSIVIQPDQKILIAGGFRAYNGVPRHQIARLFPSGALDMSFEPGPGANSAIIALCLQGDGKILIGGGFSQVDYQFRYGIARLNRDGALDLSFDPGGGADGEVAAIVELPGGGVLIGGSFFSYDYLPRPHVARLLGGNPPPSAPVIVLQSGETTVQAGENVTFFVQASGLPEPTYQWQHAGTNIPGATAWTLNLRNVRSFAAGNYTVTVSNSLGGVISLPISLTVVAPSRAPGAPDIAFDAGLGPNDRVHAIAVQDDRKILIGGAFTEVNGIPQGRIARLLPNGSLDPSFNTGLGASHTVFGLALQPDGKILAGGAFTNFNGLPRNRILRLLTNGTIDVTFSAFPGPNADVFSVAAASNGQVLIGGLFDQVDGQARENLARLTLNGSLDLAFVPAIVGYSILAIQVRPDGKVVVGGNLYAGPFFNQYGVARLLPNGSLDPTFVSYGANGVVHTLGFAASNRLALGGEFFALDGAQRLRVGRLEENGSADLTFTNVGVNGLVSALVVEPDDKLVIGGHFRSIGHFPYVGLISRERLARLNSDGSVDLSFGVGEGVRGGTSFIDEYGNVDELTSVLAIAREADGRILIGGDFTTINEIARPYIARVFSREASAAVAIHKGQGNVELVWETGILQVASEVTGPWTDLPNAQSPYLYSTGGAQQFFRLKFN